VEGNSELIDVHVESFSGSILKILILGKSDWQDFCPARSDSHKSPHFCGCIF